MSLLKKKIENLESLIRRHDRLYWDENSPEIDDLTYDQLVEELRALHPQSDYFHQVGHTPDTGEAVHHNSPMLSLQKAYELTDIHKWIRTIRDGVATLSFKIDGLALSVRYDELGRLDIAATRGDGERGENVTEAARKLIGVPHQVPWRGVEVRGEVWVAVEDFDKLFSEEFSNPRNLAAGVLRSKDPERVADHLLRFTPYDILGFDGAASEIDKNEALRAAGFTPLTLHTACEGTVEKLLSEMTHDRSSLPYETDGIVLTANDTSERLRLGVTSHHPRYSVAWKFQSESKTTTLRDIEWSVSRTGLINPVAIIDPVSLSGAEVTRVSLHNLGIMDALGRDGLREGAEVLVTRRGGVIPHLERILSAGEGQSIDTAIECPSCGSSAFRDGGTLTAYHEPHCVGAGVGNLLHFTSQISLKGFGQKVMEQLFESGLVKKPADLYRLNKEDLLSLERVGEKLAVKLLGRLDQKRTLSFDTLFASLGVPGVGKSMARKIVAAGWEWADLVGEPDKVVEGLTQIDGVGEIIANNIVRWVRAHRDDVNDLLSLISIDTPLEKAIGGALDGKEVCFTGKIPGMSRKEAGQWIVDRGGTVTDRYHHGLTYLVAGEGAETNSKYKSAVKGKVEEKSGVEIISVPDFLAKYDQA